MAHLGHCVAELQAHIAARQATTDAKKVAAHKQAQAAAEAAAVMRKKMSMPPAIDLLQHRFGLSRFERDIVVFCAAWELDHATTIAAFSTKSPAPEAPSFGLMLTYLDDAHWSATTPDGPLRRWRLVEGTATTPIISCPLRIAERTLHFLKGVPILDPHLEAASAPIQHRAPDSRGQEEALARLQSAWQNTAQSDMGMIQIVGKQDDVLTTASALAHDCAFGARRVRVRDLPIDRAELRKLAVGIDHDALLGYAMTLLWCEREDEPATRTALEWLAERVNTPILVGCDSPLDLGVQMTLRTVVRPTTNAERLESWQHHLGKRATAIVGELEQMATQFDIPPATIDRICRSNGKTEGPFLARRLWDDCVELAIPDLEGLAQRVVADTDWDDLVLPSHILERLKSIVTQVRRRAELELRWGFQQGASGGEGVTVVFAGPSGTGKTMTAGVIARELRLPLLRVDLSAIVSKWIGETEKHLRKVFDAAESGGAVLLFDEADALFGKRTEVTDSRDRHANIETSYLLQRLDQYRGLAILTTNHDEDIDEAFLRRLRGLIRFPPPGASLRRELWQKAIPDLARVDRVDFDRLAQLRLGGGHIRNVVREAAAVASHAGESMTTDLLEKVALAVIDELQRRSG